MCNNATMNVKHCDRAKRRKDNARARKSVYGDLYHLNDMDEHFIAQIFEVRKKCPLFDDAYYQRHTKLQKKLLDKNNKK